MKRRRLPGAKPRYVQHNLNFLDRPMYLPLHKSSHVTHYDDGNGFVARYAEDLGPPTAWDACILKVLVSKMERGDTTTIEVSNITSLLKELNVTSSALNDTSGYRQKIWRCLLRWKNTTYEFKNYYNGHTTEHRVFSPIDDARLDHSTGVLTVKFNELFLEECRNSFSLLQNLDKALQLSHTPIAARLYDILCAKVYAMNLQGSWPIELNKLFDKIGLNTIKHRSEKLRRLEKGMQEVQKVMKVDYSVTGRDIILFYFKDVEH